MRARHIAIGAAVVVLLGTLIWFALPKRTASDSDLQLAAATDVRAARSPSPIEAEPPPTPDDPPRPLPSPSIAILDAEEREQLANAIRAAREARRSAKAAAASPQPQAAAAQPPAEEPLSAEHVQSQIYEMKPLLAECYESARASVPDLEGQLQLRFTMEGEPEVGGIVSDSEVAGGSLAENTEFATCVRETLYMLKLPAPETGGMVVVDYPFVFSPE